MLKLMSAVAVIGLLGFASAAQAEDVMINNPALADEKVSTNEGKADVQVDHFSGDGTKNINPPSGQSPDPEPSALVSLVEINVGVSAP